MSDTVIVETQGPPVVLEVISTGPQGPIGPVGNVNPEMYTLRDQAAASASASATSAGSSQTSATASAGSAAAANTARNEAVAAANASGNVLFYNTYALANAAVGSLSDLQVVEVFVDETRGNQRTRYRKESGSLVYKLTMTASRVWYVSNSGSNANAGNTPASSFLTLAWAATVAVPGDTVRLARGSVFRETAAFSNGVVIDVYGSGQKPIISGQDIVSTFTIYGAGPAYQFTIDLTVGELNRGYPGVWEDGTRLREYRIGLGGLTDNAGVIAAVEANPGSFGFLSWSVDPTNETGNWTAGTKTYIVHATGGGNPNSNSKVYEAYKRKYAATGGYFKNIRIQNGWHHNGLDSDTIQLEDCSLERVARHGCLLIVPTHKNVISIGANPAYGGGGMFHTFSGILRPDATYYNCVAVGEAGLGQGFYQHGTVAGVSARNLTTINNCEAYNIFSCITQSEITRVVVNGFRARSVSSFCSIAANTTLDVTGLDLKGGLGGYDNSARFLSNSSGTVILRDSVVDFHTNSLLFTSGAIGPFEAYDCDFTIRTQAVPAGTRAFAQPLGAALDRLRVYRSRIIFPNGADYLIAGATSAPDMQVRDTLLVGCPTTCRINGVDVTLTSLDSSAKAFSISREKAILREDGNGVQLRYGVYQPGDFVFSGVCYSGSTVNPRVIVMVGDRIWTSDFTTDNFYDRITPSSHLNAVTFNSGGSGTCYIAVGDNGLIYKSDSNGTVWSVVGAGVTTKHLRAVWAMRNASLVVAVGDDGTVLRSTDGGATWALATSSGTTRTLYGVASNRAGTLWVAAGAEGRVITSTDGNTWTEATVGSLAWRSVWRAGEDAQFVIGGDNGSIRTSTDGASWTTRTSNTLNNVVGFAWGEGQTVALARQRSSLVDTFLTSTDDGNTWTVTDQFLPFEGRSITGPLNPMYNAASLATDSIEGFAVVGESQAMGKRARGAWTLQRIRDGKSYLSGETVTKWMNAVV